MFIAQEQVTQFLQWERATRDTIDVKKIYIDMADDLVAGVLLSQIVYWHLPNQKTDQTKLRVQKEGHLWLVKGRDDWWDECRIKPRQFDTAMDKLLDLGLVEKKKFKFDGNPTIHLRILWDRFLASFNEQMQKNTYNGETLVPIGFNESVNSNLQAKTVDTTGFNGSVNSESQIRKLDLSESVNSITENTTEITSMFNCLGTAGEIAASAETQSDDDPIHEALCRYVPAYCYVAGAPCTEYIPDIYVMLQKQFRGQIDADIIRIARELYSERAVTRTFGSDDVTMKIDIQNPVGFWRSCYVDAIGVWKLTRNNKKERIS